MACSKEIDEEFNRFFCKVTEVEKIVKKIASDDAEEAKEAMKIADLIIEGKHKDGVFSDAENREVVKCNKTSINKKSLENEESNSSNDPSQMGQKAFMKMMERDAEERRENKKVQNERADTYKRIGNDAFNQGNYEKAITYFSKALDQRKDSALLWNNRGLTYMKLGRYKKALVDFDWALRVNNSKNIKALLNSAKCHWMLGHHGKCDEFIVLAREHFPGYSQYIADFQKSLLENHHNNVDSTVNK